MQLMLRVEEGREGAKHPTAKELVREEEGEMSAAALKMEVADRGDKEKLFQPSVKKIDLISRDEKVQVNVSYRFLNSPT
jgi:hypothetical protein